ncbi:MAG: PilZ domain-containing protein [Spirochaetales bacterium]|nr:PilZ domain-containing protein [Spirochaetales bacterium]
MDERRKYERISLDIEVNFLNNAFAGLHDISEGGLCILVDEEYKTGTMLNLTLYIQETDKRIAAFCIVRWTEKASEHYYKTGLEFWHIDEKDREILGRYILTKLKQKT